MVCPMLTTKSGIDRMRDALRDIECRASSALASQCDDDATNRQTLVTVLDGIENLCRSVTWGECVPGTK